MPSSSSGTLAPRSLTDPVTLFLSVWRPHIPVPDPAGQRYLGSAGSGWAGSGNLLCWDEAPGGSVPCPDRVLCRRHQRAEHRGGRGAGAGRAASETGALRARSLPAGHLSPDLASPQLDRALRSQAGLSQPGPPRSCVIIVPLSFSVCLLVFEDGLSRGRRWHGAGLATSVPPEWSSRGGSQGMEASVASSRWDVPGWENLSSPSSRSQAHERGFLWQGRCFGFLPHVSDFTVIQT